MERSDLICQLVDARNPLFYYSSDLEAYASELEPSKPMVVVINKADYLSQAQQRDWVRHFEERGLSVLLFSARLEQQRLDQEAKAERWQRDGESPDAHEPGAQGHAAEDALGSRRRDSDKAAQEMGGDAGENDDSDSNDDSEDASGSESGRSQGKAQPGDEDPARGSEMRDGFPRMLNRMEMCTELERLARELGGEAPDPERNSGRWCVGMVGYPNVGKSSLINVLVGATSSSHGRARVNVGATPGKTKHFQTLVLSETLMLCDCPGLVFPSFVSRCVPAYHLHSWSGVVWMEWMQWMQCRRLRRRTNKQLLWAWTMRV